MSLQNLLFYGKINKNTVYRQYNLKKNNALWYNINFLTHNLKVL